LKKNKAKTSMNGNSYSCLLEKAKELKNIVQSFEQMMPLSELISSVKRSHQLTSLDLMYNNLVDYKPHIDEVMDPPTSGFSSDCYEEDEKQTRTHTLSYTEVKNLLIDTSIIWKLGHNQPEKEDL
jgi:hypothetical protein